MHTLSTHTHTHSGNTYKVRRAVKLANALAGTCVMPWSDRSRLVESSGNEERSGKDATAEPASADTTSSTQGRDGRSGPMALKGS
jgi:hypothetical protein